MSKKYKLETVKLSDKERALMSKFWENIYGQEYMKALEKQEIEKIKSDKSKIVIPGNRENRFENLDIE